MATAATHDDIATIDLTPEAPERLRALELALVSGAELSAFELFQELTAAPRQSDEIAVALAVADEAFRAGHRVSALSAVREARRRAPDRAEPAFRLCALLLGCGDPEAHALLEECLTRFPAPSPGWQEIGEVLLAKGQKAAALVCLARGIPGTDLSIRCGLLARDLGRLGEARAAFEDAVRHDTSSPRAWFLLGTAAQDARDFAAAAGAYRRVLGLDPGRAEAAVNLGTVLQETGDIVGARAAFGRALRGRADTFGRVAQALTTSPKGELWLDLAALRRSLVG